MAACSFEEQVLASRPQLVRLATRYLPHADAEEVVQQALLECWIDWEKYDPTRPFVTWAMAYVMGGILNRRKGDKVRRLHAQEPPLPSYHDTSPEALATMQDLLDKLSPTLQLVAVRVFIEGRTWEEVERRRGRNMRMVWLRAIRNLRGLALLVTLGSLIA